MDPLSITASIIAIVQLTSKAIKYLEDVKDAPKDRAQCAIELSNASTLLTKLRNRLKEGAPNELRNAEVQKLGEKDGILDQYELALDQLHAIITSRKGIKEAILWSRNKKKVEVILAQIERLKQFIQLALEMDHLKLSCVIGEGVGAMQQHQDRHHYDEILEWISSTHFPAQHSDLISNKQEGTGLWFLVSAEYTEWIHGSKKTLFCPGIPGAGKTLMAAITVEHLLKTFKCDSIGVAYLYCNYKLQTAYSTINLLAAILKQLAQCRPSAAESVVRLFNHHSRQKTRPSLGEIFGALQSITASYSSVYLVIDALDECTNRDTRSQLLDKLRSLQSNADLRILVTSRFIPEIEKEFESVPTLEVRANEADIKQYLEGRMYQLPDCVKRDDALQGLVQEKLAASVNGMFLLARLHFDSLLDKCTQKSVQSALSKLSKGSTLLDRAYDEAIKRIEGQLPDSSVLAKRILSWITYAERPLTTQELCHALAVEPDEDELDRHNISDIKDLVSVCAGLVTVDKESKTIRLVHYTTQEYFERVRDKWDPSVQLDIASTCLRYLSFSSFKSGSCPTDESFEERRLRNPLLDYAACHWAHHALTVQKEVLDLAQKFIRCDGLVACALQIISVSTPGFRFPGYSQYYPTGRTALHLLAWLGLTELLKQLIYKPSSENAISCSLEDSTGSTPLSLAVTRGYSAMVELLLTEGADINARNEYYGDALQVASCSGHEHIVKLLLSRGAIVNANCGNLGNALQAAASRGHQQVVKLLLDEGAEVNAQGGQYTNALQAASFAGHEQIVELLLDKGAMVYPKGDKSNVLQAAVQNGHDEIVRLLLNKGANVDVQGECYGYALQTASSKGFQQIVKLLLKENANVNAQSGEYGNALHTAACNGHEDIVELLLENGADINMESEFFGSALQGASYGGHEHIVELLLKANADVNVQSGHYGSALQAAVYNGHAQIIKLLLSSGANVNAQGGNHGSAIQVAACNGHQKVFQLLLENGARVNVEGIEYDEELLLRLTELQIEPRRIEPSGVDKHRRYRLYRRYLRMRRVHISSLGTRGG